MNSYHRVYTQINLDNIYHNISQIRAKSPKDVKIMPVIKADAYGHGAVAVAKILEPIADAYAVAVIEEALELRTIGVTKPILIVGTLSSSHFIEAIECDVTVAVYTLDMAKRLSNAAASVGKMASVHLVVDTGMNRIGMPCDSSSVELAKQIASLPFIDVCGIFTHFATSDEEDKTFSRVQHSRFEEFCTLLEQNGIELACKHICNSAAILDLPSSYFNMIRPGIITYGLYPSADVSSEVFDLRPAMELKTHISYVKKVPAGQGISYGLTYTTPSERIIATVPVGYADGYPRLLSGKGRVIVRGQYAPIVGRICMDQFMIDVTDIDGVREEDTVTLIGRDGGCYISADEVASHAMTINYEIICGISKRVPKVYIQDK